MFHFQPAHSGDISIRGIILPRDTTFLLGIRTGNVQGTQIPCYGVFGDLTSTVFTEIHESFNRPCLAS